jgi:hypothetical protein
MWTVLAAAAAAAAVAVVDYGDIAYWFTYQVPCRLHRSM